MYHRLLKGLKQIVTQFRIPCRLRGSVSTWPKPRGHEVKNEFYKFSYCFCIDYITGIHTFSLDVYVIYPNYVQLVNVEFLFLKIVVVRLHSLFAVLLGKTIMLVFLLCHVIGETVDKDVSIW